MPGPATGTDAPAAPAAHVFIISWRGQHTRAQAIHNAVRASFDRVTIVYSDPAPGEPFAPGVHALRRPDELYWGDKFKACLDTCESDVLFVIHADCGCADWAGLVATGLQDMHTHPDIGVWSPRIEGTPYPVTTTRIADIEDTTLTIVADTDAIVFAIPRVVQERMHLCDYAANVFGWGINAVMVASAFARQLIAVVNRATLVTHPPQRGYPADQAWKQRTAFLDALDPAERIQHELLRSHILLLRSRAVTVPGSARRMGAGKGAGKGAGTGVDEKPPGG